MVASLSEWFRTYSGRDINLNGFPLCIQASLNIPAADAITEIDRWKRLMAAGAALSRLVAVNRGVFRWGLKMRRDLKEYVNATAALSHIHSGP